MIETRFKDTEIGKIPKEWEVNNLQSISNSPSYGVSAEAIPYDGFNKYIRITDIDLSNGNFCPSPMVSPSFFSDKDILKTGDLVIARTGASVGKSYLYKKEDGRLIYAGFLMKLNISKADSQYIFYSLQTSCYWNWIASESLRTGQPGINLQQIQSYTISLPPLPEQRRIATALSNVDALISAVEKKIEKKKLIKQGAMQQLLTGKKRLNGYKGEWVEKRLGEGLSFQPGYPFASKYFNNSIGIRLIKNRDLKADDTIVYYQGDCPKEFLVQDGDLLVGMDGDFLPCLWNKGPALLNQRVGRLNIIGKWDRKFLYYYLYEPLLKMQEGTGATTVKHLSHTDIEKIILPIPDPSEQRAIASILSNMDSEITALERKRDKLKELKQGMMQQLLTGKIRLVRCSG